MNIKKLSYILIIGVIVIVTTYAGLLIFLSWPITELTISTSGVFGDSFGILSSLFSGLAFAGLIITIIMQKDELALQREELELTRKEISGQKEELKIQNETMKIQKFENTFFQMLSLHNEILKGIDISQYVGRDAFQELYNRLHKQNYIQPLKDSDLKQLNQFYINFSSKYENEIGHYFRNLYNIIKFIDASEVTNKKLYTNLVRAQLSNFELFFLFYNCLSDMGYERFKPLVEKYSLLKNLPDKLILNPSTHKSFYENNAFKST